MTSNVSARYLEKLSESERADFERRYGPIVGLGFSSGSLGVRPKVLAKAPAMDPCAGMNGTEREYATSVLEPRRKAGISAAWWYQGLTLKLATDCRYTPDFVEQLADGTLDVIEVKGHWRDDAKVKLRVAAQLYPFRFRAVKKQSKADGGGFSSEDF